MGNGLATPTSGGPSSLVARVLSFRAAPRLTARSDSRASECDRARETPIPETHPSHGSRADDAPLDHAIPPLLPLAAAPGLSRGFSNYPLYSRAVPLLTSIQVCGGVLFDIIRFAFPTHNCSYQGEKGRSPRLRSKKAFWRLATERMVSERTRNEPLLHLKF